MSAPDPVSIAVISQSLLAAAREMGTKLCRSAYSSIVREVKDASAGILDAQGRAVAQCDHLTPMLVGSLSLTLKACMDRYPVETIREGDFYINNHPYAGGHHSNDIFIFMPIFFDGRLLGFSASVAHHVDIGGGAVGINHSATDYYQEGLVLPPSRYNLERDWNDGPLEQLIRANVRVPEQTLGDLNAQFAANRVGILRVQELCAKYGTDLVAAAILAVAAGIGPQRVVSDVEEIVHHVECLDRHVGAVRQRRGDGIAAIAVHRCPVAAVIDLLVDLIAAVLLICEREGKGGIETAGADAVRNDGCQRLQDRIVGPVDRFHARADWSRRAGIEKRTKRRLDADGIHHTFVEGNV
jgi:hypothetical protein